MKSIDSFFKPVSKRTLAAMQNVCKEKSRDADDRKQKEVDLTEQQNLNEIKVKIRTNYSFFTITYIHQGSKISKFVKDLTADSGDGLDIDSVDSDSSNDSESSEHDALSDLDIELFEKSTKTKKWSPRSENWKVIAEHYNRFGFHQTFRIFKDELSLYKETAAVTVLSRWSKDLKA